MLGIDLDLQRYIATRKGEVEQRARDGAAYAFSGERKVRRALGSARPVAIAIEATGRQWKGAARNKLLDRCELATDANHRRLYDAGNDAAKKLGLSPVPLYVSDGAGDWPVMALGTDDDAYVIIKRDLLDQLSDDELRAAVGYGLGHIQNNQVLFATALYYLLNDAFFFVRWIVRPAVMALQAWARRAEVTCDRAALLCAPNLTTAVSALLKASGRADDDAEQVLAALDEEGPHSSYAELFRSHPGIDKRIAALKVFAASKFHAQFRGEDNPDGDSSDQVDAKVTDILSVF